MSAGNKGATRMRVRAMIRKESLQILRDPSSIAIAFIMPLVLLLLFGYGVSLDARHIRLALVVEQPDANTASLTGAFQQSEYFATVSYRHINKAEDHENCQHGCQYPERTGSIKSGTVKKRQLKPV